MNEQRTKAVRQKRRRFRVRKPSRHSGKAWRAVAGVGTADSHRGDAPMPGTTRSANDRHNDETRQRSCAGWRVLVDTPGWYLLSRQLA